MHYDQKNFSVLPLLFGLVAGVLFAAGLWLGGMTDPSKVQGFLDFFGEWKPALAFVLGAAVMVSALSYALARRASRPWLAPAFEIPRSKVIDRPLLLGAALFGVGWGLAGYCPGPAVVAVGQGSIDAMLFSFFMVVGMFAYSRTNKSS